MHTNILWKFVYGSRAVGTITMDENNKKGQKDKGNHFVQSTTYDNPSIRYTDLDHHPSVSITPLQVGYYPVVQTEVYGSLKVS